MCEARPRTLDDLLSSIGCDYVPTARCTECHRELTYPIPWRPHGIGRAGGSRNQWARCADCNVWIPVHRYPDGRIVVNPRGARRACAAVCPRCGCTIGFRIQMKQYSKFVKTCFECGGLSVIEGHAGQFSIRRYRVDTDPTYDPRDDPDHADYDPPPDARPGWFNACPPRSSEANRRDAARARDVRPGRSTAHEERRKWGVRAAELCVGASDARRIADSWPLAA